MSSPQDEPELPPQVADDLRQVIALLADACWEADKRRLRRGAGLGAVMKPVGPVAEALVRHLAEGNPRRAEALLSVHRTQAEWRRLAVALASAADLERLVVSARPKPRREAA